VVKDARTELERILEERIAVLDGSWGVLIHRRGFTEEEYRGVRFHDHRRDLRGDPDLLNLTQPHVVSEIHHAYFEAGADIATTNTFTATRIGQADYGLEELAAEMSLEAPASRAGPPTSGRNGPRTGRASSRARWGRSTSRSRSRRRWTTPRTGR
jgi:5-methyltetrahydrofolate--homocysteine methyltransferase